VRAAGVLAKGRMFDMPGLERMYFYATVRDMRVCAEKCATRRAGW